MIEILKDALKRGVAMILIIYITAVASSKIFPADENEVTPLALWIVIAVLYFVVMSIAKGKLGRLLFGGKS
jgi:hypothetical protein